jgi:hypothetical protein
VAGRVVVRLRPTRRTLAQLAGRALLAAVAAAFVAGGAADPASVGGVLFLVLGVAGLALFGGGAVALAGHLLARRPLLEIDDDGVHRPAAWPRSRRLLRWDDLAAVALWRQGVPAGRSHREFLTFIPRRALAGTEIAAIGPAAVPAIAPPQWSLPVSAAWDHPVDEVVAAVRRHRDVPFADRRS